MNQEKVLVTDSDGLIGSHLVEMLLRENCRVKAFVYYNSFNSWGWIDSFPKDKLKGLLVFDVMLGALSVLHKKSGFLVAKCTGIVCETQYKTN